MEKNNLTIKERASNFIQKLKKKNTSDDNKEDSKVEEVSKVRLSKHMYNYHIICLATKKNYFHRRSRCWENLANI